MQKIKKISITKKLRLSDNYLYSSEEEQKEEQEKEQEKEQEEEQGKQDEKQLM